MGLFDSTASTLEGTNTWADLQNQGANYVYDPNNAGAWGSLQGADANYIGSTGGTGPDTGGGGWGSAAQWASGLKDIAGGLKGAGLPQQTMPARNPYQAGAGIHQGTAGALGTLLQLLAQRAAQFNAAAHQGAVPARVQGGQGLLGV